MYYCCRKSLKMRAIHYTQSNKWSKERGKTTAVARAILRKINDGRNKKEKFTCWPGRFLESYELYVGYVCIRTESSRGNWINFHSLRLVLYLFPILLFFFFTIVSSFFLFLLLLLFFFPSPHVRSPSIFHILPVSAPETHRARGGAMFLPPTRFYECVHVIRRVYMYTSNKYRRI